MKESKLQFRLRGLLLFVAGIAILLTAYRWWPLDGWIGIVFGSGSHHDTVWAEEYSDDGWSAVRVGMKRNDVYAILGRPLEIRNSRGMFDFDTIRQNPGEIVECWTQSPNDSSYFLRHVVFSGDIVVDKINEFYID
jgi:hypothetical protein